MTNPTMCSGADRPPVLPRDVVRDIALAEASAIRLEALVDLIRLAHGDCTGSGAIAIDLTIEMAMKQAMITRERLQEAVAGLDSELADVDVLTDDVGDGEE